MLKKMRKRADADKLYHLLCKASDKGFTKILKKARTISHLSIGNALSKAIQEGNEKVVSRCLQLESINRSTESNDRETFDFSSTALLLLAARCGNPNIIRILAKYYPVTSADSMGMTPLHLAPNKETVDCLIELGAPIDAISELGETPLCSAILKQNVPVLLALYQNGANINPICTKTSMSPLHAASIVSCAADANGAELLELLYSFGANPLSIDADNNTIFKKIWSACYHEKLLNIKSVRTVFIHTLKHFLDNIDKPLTPCIVNGSLDIIKAFKLSSDYEILDQRSQLAFTEYCIWGMTCDQNFLMACISDIYRLGLTSKHFSNIVFGTEFKYAASGNVFTALIPEVVRYICANHLSHVGEDILFFITSRNTHYSLNRQ